MHHNLVVFSVTETGDLCSSYGCFPTIVFKNKTSRISYMTPDDDISTGSQGMYIGLTGDYSHFNDLWGKIYFMELPAGEYEVTKWIAQSYTISTGYMKISNKSPLNNTFTVSDNNITYIGSFNIEYHYSSFLGFNGLAEGTFTATDNFDKDISIAKKKYKNFKGENTIDGFTKRTLSINSEARH